MKTLPSRFTAALAFAFVAASAVAQPTRVGDAAAGSGSSLPTSGVSHGTAGPGFNSGINMTPMMTTPIMPGVGAAPAPQGATPGAAAAAVPVSASGGASPFADQPAVEAAVPASAAAGAEVAAESGGATSGRVGVASLTQLHGTVSAAPSAASALTGAAGTTKINATGADENVRSALERIFEADARRMSGVDVPSAVAGRDLSVVDGIAKRVKIAEKLGPVEAPGVFLDAVNIAKESVRTHVLTPAAAEKIIAIVRGAAARQMNASWTESRSGERKFIFDEIAAAAYGAASAGDKKETARALASYDQWETLLAAPGQPLLTGVESLKSDVRAFLSPDAEARPNARSAPHVFFKRQGTTYAAVLPSASRVPAIPVLATGYRLTLETLSSLSLFPHFLRGPSKKLGAFAAAQAVYRDDLAASDSASASASWVRAPAAALRAARYWFARVLETIRRVIAALFFGAPSYDLSRDAGRDSLRHAAALSETARGEAVAARRLLSGTRTFAGVERAFAAAARSAAAFDALTGESFSRSVAALRAAFADASREAEPSAWLSARAAAYVDGPGGLSEVVQRIDANARVDEASLSFPAGDGVVDLGEKPGRALAVATRARAEIGSGAVFATAGDQLWARAPGVSLSAGLKDSEAGGFVEIRIARADAALAKRFESLGFLVTLDGNEMRATAGGDGSERDSETLGALAGQGLAAALGRTHEVDTTLRRLVQEQRRDPKSAESLAMELDGESVLGAPVIGYAGEDRVVGPVPTSVRGRVRFLAVFLKPSGLPHYALPLTAR